jgi:hypothetical protein
MITIGLLAKTYGQLPSYVLANATTYDLRVMDTVAQWENQAYEQSQGKKSVPKLSQQQMMDMINKVKKKPQ